MSVTLDGQNLFGSEQLIIEQLSVGRDFVERSAAGLDGVVSIDLGKRSREIKQKGVMRAVTKTQMNEKIDAISAFLDGDTHTLITADGDAIENLRLDVVKVTNERASGVGMVCDYEIVYRQLVG